MKSNPKPIRIFLVCEQRMLREGLRILIDSWPGLTVAAEADGAMQAVTMLDTVEPALILVSDHGNSGALIGRLFEVAKAAGEAPIIYLTGSRDPEVSASALAAGARSIVRRDQAPAALRQAIEKVHDGETWPDRTSHTAQVLPYRPLNGLWRSKADSLTPRELEVAVLVSPGCTNRQIGKRLGISAVTVRHHLTSIFGKLRIADRFKLVVWLYEQGIVKPGGGRTEPSPVVPFPRKSVSAGVRPDGASEAARSAS